MHGIFIAIGSNVNPAFHLGEAKIALEKEMDICQCSAIYKSEAVGFEGPAFLNQVLEVKTALSPQDLKAKLHAIEKTFNSGSHTGMSRCVDLDLLLYNDSISFHRDLELPSDDILKYTFILRPLSEIAGNHLHPLLKRSYKDLWAGFHQTITPLDSE